MTWFKRIKGLEWEPERGARCTSVLTCALKELLSMLMKIAFKSFRVALGFQDGRI